MAAMAEPSGIAADSATLDQLGRLYRAQVQSRHLDLAARWLHARGEGFYTIGSAGHEANAAVALALRPSDPALLHYRSGAFYAARASQVPNTTPVRDVLLSLAVGRDDPASGGRHKVFGSRDLSIIPQTSTIASHLPRALGLAYALDQRRALDVRSRWPDDALVVCSFGDASLNHSTAQGALNAAAYLQHRRVGVPLLLVCEDNGLGISTPSPPGWVAHALQGRFVYRAVDGADATGLLAACGQVADEVRTSRRPVVLHLRTQRYGGHAGSDTETAYRSRASIVRDFARDPLLGTARALVAGGVPPDRLVRHYETVRRRVMREAAAVCGTPRLTTAGQVLAPVTSTQPGPLREAAQREAPRRADVFADRPPEHAGGLTLAQAINATLTDVMAAHPAAVLFGEDVAVKGGVYGVTRGLRKRFGGRAFDTLLDEQTIIGTALGAALAGYLPLPEIQYLAYLHNAEDQLRGEAASLRFFSAGQYGNGMVVRIAGLAYQRGFGGHFHNDNSLAVLRDIPGLVVAVPAHPADAPGLLRSCIGAAVADQRVCVYLEPIARYHTRDLHDGDGAWLAPYRPPSHWDAATDGIGRTRRHGEGRDLLIVTFGNGLYLSLRCRERLAGKGIHVSILDLRWLAPLPEAEIVAAAAQFDRVLMVDETRRCGGIGEPVLACLAEHGFAGAIRRVASADSFIPLGPAADAVLLQEDEIVQAAVAMCSH